MVALEQQQLTQEQHIEEIEIRGFTVVPDVLPQDELPIIREKLDALVQLDIEKFTREHLLSIKELGTLRFMMANDRYFLSLLNIRKVMDIIEQLLGEASILHLQNGIVLIPSETHQQGAWHQDYRRWMNGFNVSYNVFLLIDEFTNENGGTLVVPGTHVLEKAPSQEYLQRYTHAVTGKAGSALIFNSRLWHAGGRNKTLNPRRAINQQYTTSYIRSQGDYANCLPEEEYAALPERVQQLLGRFVRMPKSIDEFRVPADKRFYRGGQG